MERIEDKQSIRTKYLIDLKDYQRGKYLNHGSYGDVAKIINKTTKEEYAAKFIHEIEGEYTKLTINREIGIMIRLQHPTLIRFVGYSLKDFEDQECVVIIMEYAKNGSLASVLEKNRIEKPNVLINNTTRQKILIGISYAMMYLHRNRVIHRDLKPHNVVLDEFYHPHLTDFGASKFTRPGHTLEQTGQIGTCVYMAPEVMEDSIFDIKADVYSFCIIMYEIITGKSAFGHLGKISGFNFSKKIIEGVRPLIKKGAIKQKGLRVMMKMCWDKNPSKRPSFSEIFKKLSLSTNDFLLGFENNPEKEIINVNEKDSEDDQAEIEFEEKKIEDMKKKEKI